MPKLVIKSNRISLKEYEATLLAEGVGTVGRTSEDALRRLDTASKVRVTSHGKRAALNALIHGD